MMSDDNEKEDAADAIVSDSALEGLGEESWEDEDEEESGEKHEEGDSWE